jgi:hypothetical protein
MIIMQSTLSPYERESNTVMTYESKEAIKISYQNFNGNAI